MADLYSVIPGLQVSQQDILQAELLAQQVLQAQYPDLDLRAGTGIRDLTIRPNALLLALTKTALDYYFTQNTLSGVTDSTSTDIVDSILSNWFLTRNTGEAAIINARLYFARQKTITISTDVYFSPDNSLLYYPATTYSFNSDALTYDSSSNEYYVDVDLTAAATGTSYNISSGSLLYFGSFDAYFLHAEINYLSQTSTDAETNTEFIDRASSSISTRNLINVPSIKSNLQDNFNYLNQIFTVGMGDADMIRDQVYAYLTAPVARTVTAFTFNDTLATVTLAAHGYEIGQEIAIRAGKPSIINGNYTITETTTDTFQYELDQTPSLPVTVLPTVTAVYYPVLIHNGGMTDVYCGNTLESEVVQLTTDVNGDATLTGPIYAFSRSSVTGGTADDTIPVSANLPYTAETITNNNLITVTQALHGLTTGQAITLSGLTQTQTINSISCSGYTVTVTCPSHGLSTGMNVVIAGVLPTTYNGTFTIVVTSANTFTLTVAAIITAIGTASDSTVGMYFTNPNINTTTTVTVVDTNTYTLPLSGSWSVGTITGTPVIASPVSYTISNPYAQTLAIANFVAAGTTVTVTVNNHSVSVGQYVQITGMTPTGYNSSWKVETVADQNTLTFTLPAAITGDISFADGEMITVIPWEDVGFSTRQEITLSFGATYAQQTASFLTNQFQYLDSVQTYLEDAANRITSGDILARGFNFYLLDLNLVSYSSTLPDTTTITTTANSYLTGLSAGSTFIMADLIALLYEAGVTEIQTPIGITYTQYTRYLTNPNTGTITDYLDPADDTNIFILGTVTATNMSV